VFTQSVCLTAYLLLALGLLAGCAGTTTKTVVAITQFQPPALPPGIPPILHVPVDYPTIQAAVDAARPGQMILIAPGAYREAVRVNTPDITIRGEDRNRVILDGKHQLSSGIEIEADNVVVENMTARYYAGNGFYWDGGEDASHPRSGFRGSYLTAYANGDYDIYAYNFQNGQFDHSYAAGSPDAGFYIGQCYPCNAVIDDVVSEWNALGYSGTNAGGNLIIRDSTWHDNLAGIFPNTLDSEGTPPEHQTVVINNDVDNNNNDQAPASRIEYPLIGTGIGVPGGVGNDIINNHVSDQRNYGIVVLSSADKNVWLPADNRVIGNMVTNSGVADLALAAPTGPGNCFSDNMATRTLPALIEQKYPCDTPLASLEGGDSSISAALFSRLLYANSGVFHPRDWRTIDASTIPASQHQPSMLNVAGPALPIFPDPSVFALPALAQVPAVPHSALQPLTAGGPSVLQFLLGLYAELLPLAIYAAWLALGFWDLARNEKMSNAARLIWMVVLVVVPILGPIAYFLFGRSALSRSFRVMLVVGAPLLYLLVTGVLLWVASLTA
jgi:hypothetical protein